MGAQVFQIASGADDAMNTNISSGYTSTSTTIQMGIDAGVTPSPLIGLRWTNVTVAQGTTITSATVDFYMSGAHSGTGSFNTYFYGVAADNFSGWNSGTSSGNSPWYEANFNQTAHGVTHSLSIATWSSSGFGHDVVDITTVVNDIISRVGWVSGNALAITIDASNGSNNQYGTFNTYDLGAAYGAKLTINTPGGGTPTNKPRLFLNFV